MVIYLILIALLIALTFMPKDNKRLSEYLFWGMAAVLVILAGYRYGIGTDYSTYYHYYDNIRLGGEPWYWMDFEQGFVWLNQLIGLLYCPPEVFMLIVSAITVFLILYTCDKLSLDRTLSMLLFVTLYFYFSSFNILRQYLAVAIVFFSFSFLKEKKIIPYMLCVVAAALFHKTALIMIPVYFIAYFKFSLRIQAIFLGFCLLMAIFGRAIISFVLSFFPKYSAYANFEAGSAWFNLGVLCTVYGLSFFVSRNRKLDENGTVYRNLCVAALGMTLLTYCNVLFARMAVYLYVFTLLAIPYFISKLEKRLKFPVKVAAVAMSCVLCVYYFLHNTDEVVPYMFAFMN